MIPCCSRRTLLVLLAAAGSCAVAKGASAMTMTLTSTAFGDKEPIPSKYTCEGDNVSPPLAWSGVPEGTRTLALVVDDPDAPDPRAPKRTFVHWVLYDLPAGSTSLPEHVTRDRLPPGTREGHNDRKRAGWAGPCPPIGRHRYFFKLYALDTSLPALGPASEADLDRAMEGHILARAELVGTYQKRAR